MVEAIVNQKFEPGSQVNIDTLARHLKMSNTPVREALMRATGERLVTQQSNRGFIVTDILRPSELKELFEVRFLIEVHSLETGEIAGETIDRLEQLVEHMDTAQDGLLYKEFKDYLRDDHLFHRTIVSLANNSLLIKSWEGLHVHLHLSRLYTGVGLFDRSSSAREHRHIVEALRLDNRAQAVEMLSQHILDVRNRMLDFLQTG
jgi:DNA-binding GntR family transcriptional regulator